MQTPLELQIQTLPENPGVYQYYDKDEKILYVGKAKNLKKRVQSYFKKNHDNYKTAVLVKKIVSIKHIVVPTESDALLLENNLIKKLQPHLIVRNLVNKLPQPNQVRYILRHITNAVLITKKF